MAKRLVKETKLTWHSFKQVSPQENASILVYTNLGNYVYGTYIGQERDWADNGISYRVNTKISNRYYYFDDGCYWAYLRELFAV